MNPHKYIEERLAVLTRAGMLYEFGEYCWHSLEAGIPTGRIILIADHENGRWMPSLAIANIRIEGSMRIVQTIEVFSGVNMSCDIWSYLPMPDLRNNSKNAGWTEIKDKNPERDGYYLALTNRNEIFLTIKQKARFSDNFVLALSYRPPAATELLFADVAIRPAYWIELPRYPERTDSE